MSVAKRTHGSVSWLDPVGGIAVGVLIAKTGLDLLSGNYYNLMDRQDLAENEGMIAHRGDGRGL